MQKFMQQATSEHLLFHQHKEIDTWIGMLLIFEEVSISLDIVWLFGCADHAQHSLDRL